MSNTWMGRSARRMLILAIVPLTAAATTATAGGRDGRGGICTRTAGLQKQEPLPQTVLRLFVSGMEIQISSTSPIQAVETVMPIL